MFNKQKGQSLVEVALFLPILIILLAGIVELSQLTITKNKVTTAARTAVGFGANGGEGMVTVALNSITQTLKLDEPDWDIWEIRGQVNNDGTAIEDFEIDHSYGISNTQLFSNVLNIQEHIWNELQIDENNNTIPQWEREEKLGDLRFVGIYISHDVPSILGLDVFPALKNFTSVDTLSVMRITGLNLEPTKGCTAFPIGISDGVRSVSDIPIQDAQEGDVFELEKDIYFDWLVWNTIYLEGNSTDLQHSLAWRGDSIQYPTYGYYEPGDPTDTSLNIGDWVAKSNGDGNVEDHIVAERMLQVIVWDNKVDNTYHIYRFAVIRILDQDGDRMIIEFIRWNDSCGQNIP